MILMLFIATIINQDSQNLFTQFEKAYRDEEVTKEMIQHLESNKHRTALETAYLGAFNMLMANHSNNPFNKVAYFQEGKEWIAQAVRKDPDHIEIRYLRFMNQVETPRILGYKGEVSADKKMILDNLINHKGTERYDRIVKYLKHCSELTESEKARL